MCVSLSLPPCLYEHICAGFCLLRGSGKGVIAKSRLRFLSTLYYSGIRFCDIYNIKRFRIFVAIAGMALLTYLYGKRGRLCRARARAVPYCGNGFGAGSFNLASGINRSFSG